MVEVLGKKPSENSRNSEASVSNDGKIPGFYFVSFLFLSSVIKFDKKCANSTQRSQLPNS